MPDGTQTSEFTDQISFRGRKWVVHQSVNQVQRALQAKGMKPAMAGILSARGITINEIDDYLDPKLRNLLPDPSRFKDMDTAAIHTANKIQAGAPISIWSDYDCDGVTSAALLARFYQMIGLSDVPVRIPDRIMEGYGPNANGMREVKASGIDTVYILDAGIVAFDALNAAKEADLNVVVLDHHMADDNLPPAVAVVNANRKDEAPGFGHLCAAGIVFIFCVAVTRELKNRGYFDGKEGRPFKMPDLMTLLPIVALGTVADVVPLTTLNRAFVTRGLEQMNAGSFPGLKHLALVAGIEAKDPITAKDLGWKLGPRINAGGRIDNAMIGVNLLMSDDEGEAKALAERLDAINAQRKAIEEKVTEAALEQFEDREAGVDRRIAVAVVEDAHEGVVGISAGRLKEACDCPAIVLAKDHEGNLKGSARSVKGFDIGHTIVEARKAGLILRGGGHGMAGGLSLTPEQLPGFEAFANAEIEKSDYFRDGLAAEADLNLSAAELTVEIIDDFSRMEPFGTGNTSPLVILENVTITEIRILKEKHLKLTISGGPKPIDALIWGVVGTPIGDFLMNSTGVAIDLYGEPAINEWRGNKKVQMIIEDVREHKGLLI